MDENRPKIMATDLVYDMIYLITAIGLPPGGSSVLGPIQLTNSSDHTAFKDT
jgi:hypothetical protein